MSHMNSLHYSCITIAMYCACVRACVHACIRGISFILNMANHKPLPVSGIKPPQCIMVQVDTDNHTDCTLYV